MARRLHFLPAQEAQSGAPPSVNIYVVNVDDGEFVQLTRDAGINGNPNYSPDGKQIVFSSTRDSFPRSKIWIMNADGSNQRILPNPQNSTGTAFGGGEPGWSPDGTKILFIGPLACGKRGANRHLPHRRR